MAIVNREHHAMANWSFSDLLRRQFPWELLAIEWAYTGKRTDHQGKEMSDVLLAERWLLSSYNDSFGEYPPWNQKG